MGMRAGVSPPRSRTVSSQAPGHRSQGARFDRPNGRHDPSMATVCGGAELENVLWPAIAVDSSGAPVMGLLPETIKHIPHAATLLRLMEGEKIPQLGESIVSVRKSFSALHKFRLFQVVASGPIWTQNCT